MFDVAIDLERSAERASRTVVGGLFADLAEDGSVIEELLAERRVDGEAEGEE